MAVRAHLLLIPLLVVCITACSRGEHRNNKAQGYVEGRYTYVATSVPGTLKQLPVERGTLVRAGGLLFALEEQPESDAYNAAAENLREAIAARDAIAANLQYARLTYERYRILVPKNAIQQSQLDSAKSIYVATLAQLSQANATIAASRATLAQAAWTKSQKMGKAPVDAIVFDTFYRLGEYTVANQPIVSLLAPADIKAIFFVPEAILGKLRLGGPVKVRCDGCDHLYDANISFISPTAEYTPPVIYSNETNAKLIFRIEAKFAKEDAFKMHPGQPLIVTYLP